MPESVTQPVFTLSYVPTVEDVAETVSAGARESRRAAWRRIFSASLLILFVLVTLAGQDDGSGRASFDELIGVWVLGWGCALLWGYARRLILLSPRRIARRRREHASAFRTTYEVELSEYDLTSRTDELALKMPWSAFAEVEETERQFILKRPGGEMGFALPKRGLPDTAHVDALRAFLHAHIRHAR